MRSTVEPRVLVSGPGQDPSELSALLWPGNDRVVFVGCRVWSTKTCSYYYWVDMTPPDVAPSV